MRRTAKSIVAEAISQTALSDGLFGGCRPLLFF